MSKQLQEHNAPGYVPQENLWQLAELTIDFEFIKANFYIDWHRGGTRYGIRVDSDGLLRAGEPGAQRRGSKVQIKAGFDLNS